MSYDIEEPGDAIVEPFKLDDSDNTELDEASEMTRTEYGPNSYVEEFGDGSSYTYERQDFGEDSTQTTEIWENEDGSSTSRYEVEEGGYSEQTTVIYDGSDTYDIHSEAVNVTEEETAYDIINRDD